MRSMKQLPWVEPFLYSMCEEYKKSSPDWKLLHPSVYTRKYVYSVANQEDPFDTKGLKKECGEALRKGEATLLQCVSSFGEILVVSMNTSPVKLTWNLWWRCVRLLIPKKKFVRVLIFGHPSPRDVPTMEMQIEKGHINGGSAFRCDPSSIVIYRKEECTRVLIHELLHASCSDPYYKSTPEIEADTEAWAEMMLCGMAARGQLQPWIRYMREQISWSVRQASTVYKKYNVKSIDDYAWRYLIGRLIVWRRLGISVPSITEQFLPVKTLRFTICEPIDI